MGDIPPLGAIDAERINRRKRVESQRLYRVIAADGTIHCAVCASRVPASTCMDGRVTFDAPQRIERETGATDEHGAPITETVYISPATRRGHICPPCAVRFNAQPVTQVDTRQAKRGLTIRQGNHFNTREQRLAAEVAELDVEEARQKLITAGFPEWAALFAAVEATGGKSAGTWAHTGNPSWITGWWHLLYDRRLRWTADELAHQWRRDSSYHWKLDPVEDVSDGRWRYVEIVRADGSVVPAYHSGVHGYMGPGMRGWDYVGRLQARRLSDSFRQELAPSGVDAENLLPVRIQALPERKPVRVWVVRGTSYPRLLRPITGATLQPVIIGPTGNGPKPGKPSVCGYGAFSGALYPAKSPRPRLSVDREHRIVRALLPAPKVDKPTIVGSSIDWQASRITYRYSDGSTRTNTLR